MKILIISDSHHNLENLSFVLENYAKDCDKLIHCGDFNDEETVDYIIKNFKKEKFFVWGNADKYIKDLDWEEKYKKEKVHFYEKIGKFKIKNKRIAICHYPQTARKLFESNDFDFVFYGHSHKPFIEENKNHFLLNSGNVAGLYYPASFTIWDFEKTNFKLYILKELINKKK